eukprot:gb/GECH01007422.1/.p1 GENE.gb/GECH01007422.1/~~gb/GECH01007422.1/.p1  ORF type:complete len:261 (+),score=45.28 gb/GECH01007422.1/:1-783(+)
MENSKCQDLGKLVSKIRDKDTGFSIADRRWHLRKYPNCFVASEAVDWMIGHKHASSREEAVSILQILHDHGVFYHAANLRRRTKFEDEYLFYTFQDSKVVESLIDEGHQIMSTCQQSIDLDEATASSAGLEALIRELGDAKNGLEIKNRRHRLFRYDNSFVGAQAVDVLMQRKGATRLAAFDAIQKMMDQGYVACLNGNKTVFQDDHDVLYRFISPDDAKHMMEKYTISDFNANDIDGNEVNLGSLCENRVALVVNVASQ